MGSKALRGQIVFSQRKPCRIDKPPVLRAQIDKSCIDGGKALLSSANHKKKRAVEVPLQKAMKGLKKLHTLIGWEVVMKESGEALGVVDDVFSADSFDNLYLKVVQDSLKTSSFRTVHLIPLVPDIVPSLIVVANKVMLTPPDGLLDIGRSKEKIAELRTELAAYTTHPSGCFGDRLGITYMPKKDALESVGRADLVSAVRSCGGFVVVAGALGWMTHRKPEGFWEQNGILDQEIGLFVASRWEQLKDKDGESFYYNQVSRRITWEIPVLPELIPLSDDGSSIFVEDDAHRYMPTRKIVKEAGRYDLHHAIVSHGGYNAVAEKLDRCKSLKMHEFDAGQRAISLKNLYTFIVNNSLNAIPSKEYVMSKEQSNIWKIIQELGPHAIAEHLGLMPLPKVHNNKMPKTRRRWSSFEEVLSHFRTVLKEHSFVTSNGKCRMPTYSELRNIGRSDLLYQLTKFGSQEIALSLGIAPNRPGRKSFDAS